MSGSREKPVSLAVSLYCLMELRSQICSGCLNPVPQGSDQSGKFPPRALKCGQEGITGALSFQEHPEVGDSLAERETPLEGLCAAWTEPVFFWQLMRNENSRHMRLKSTARHVKGKAGLMVGRQRGDKTGRGGHSAVCRDGDGVMHVGVGRSTRNRSRPRDNLEEGGERPPHAEDGAGGRIKL